MWVTAAAMAAARGANILVISMALDALPCLPADGKDKDNFSSVGSRGGGKGGGWGEGGKMIIDP